MLYEIENSKIKVVFSDKGGEMQSLVLKETGKEYIWQGDPKYWMGKAYNLFPICGRLIDGKYTYKGKTYEMNLHGFVRHSVLEAEKLSDTSVCFTLKSNEQTRAQYPFEFTYKVTYVLEDTRVKTVYEVVNDGSEKMYFAVGGHPGFNVPLNEGEAFEDHYVEFDCVKPLELIGTTPFFCTGKNERYELEDGKILPLDHSLFDNDAKFFTNMCKYVTLKSKKSGSFVRLEYPKMRNVGFWHAPKSDAPYLCIEPWSSVPDADGPVGDLENKAEMETLMPKEAYIGGFDIIIG